MHNLYYYYDLKYDSKFCIYAIYYTHTDITYTICLLGNSIFKIVWDLNYACLNQNI